MKILVTGGAGFIGSNIVDKLVEKNHEVFIIDNLITGQKENVNPEAVLYEIDIVDHEKVDGIIKNEKPDIIYHLAAQIDVRKSVADPLNDAKINILASKNLINSAIKHGVKKFIFSSTGGAIYGETDIRPTPENHPEWPLSPYGIGKLTVDKYLNYAHKIHGLRYNSLRYANVYGPRQNPHGEAGVVAVFLNKMLRDEQPTINGEGLQTRDYVFVGDIADANISALENLDQTGVYNIGTGVETDVNMLFDEINKNFDHKFQRNYGPAKIGEQMTSSLDSAQIKRDFNWKPKVDLSDGIRMTFEWFKSKYHGN